MTREQYNSRLREMAARRKRYEPNTRLSEDQYEAMKDIKRRGGTDDFTLRTLNSLFRRGLISRPRKGEKDAHGIPFYWCQFTEAGKFVYARNRQGAPWD